MAWRSSPRERAPLDRSLVRPWNAGIRRHHATGASFAHLRRQGAAARRAPTGVRFRSSQRREPSSRGDQLSSHRLIRGLQHSTYLCSPRAAAVGYSVDPAMADQVSIPGVELLEELGHGTYSVVYRARRGSDVYAVKIPLRNETGTKLRILGRRFRREAVALARLRHPLLPKIMEVGMVDRAPYMIMELAVGVTLAERLTQGAMT